MNEKQLVIYCNAVAQASFKKRNLVISTSQGGENTFKESVSINRKPIKKRPRVQK